MPDKKVKFAVVGYGHIGKRHAELIMQHPQAELVGIIDVIPNSGSVPNIPYYTGLSDFLAEDSEAQVVNICTPNGLHAMQAVECLTHQKNVVIEKPIALSKADAQAILKTSRQNGKHVFPVVQNRYSPTIKWLKELIVNKRLGEIFTVQLNCFWNRDERYYTGGWHGTLKLDGGPLYTQFSHFIDVLLWVFGDIVNIQTKFADYNHQSVTEFEDSGIVLFDFVKEGTGVINYSTAVYQSNMESSIIVIGEKGTVKIGGQYMNRIEYCDVEREEQPLLQETYPMNNYGLYQGSASNHQFVIDNVVEVLTNGSTPDVTIEDGLNVVEVIEQIYANRIVDKKLAVTNSKFSLYH